MKKVIRCAALFLISAVVLSSCGGEGTPSGSSSGGSESAGSASTVSYNPKDDYKEYGGTIDLRAASDLSKVAFCVNDRDGCRLVINTGSGDKTAYTSQDGYVVYGTQWSPDGRYVSFYDKRYGATRHLFLYDTSSEKVTDVGVEGVGIRNRFYEVNSIWSGDSSKVVFQSTDGGGYYDIATGKVVKIGDSPIDFCGASFSPDSSKILYYVSPSVNHANYKVPFKVYDIKAKKSAQVCALDAFDGSSGGFFAPVWISDTEFLENKFADTLVYKIDVTTGKSVDYLTDVWYNVYLSPDGKYLAYQHSSDDDSVIRDIANGAETVIKGARSMGNPVWSYDSQKVMLCKQTSILTFGLDGKQIGETLTIPTQYGYFDFSTPVYTKDGLWYEGVKS